MKQCRPAAVSARSVSRALRPELQGFSRMLYTPARHAHSHVPRESGVGEGGKEERDKVARRPRLSAAGAPSRLSRKPCRWRPRGCKGPLTRRRAVAPLRPLRPHAPTPRHPRGALRRSRVGPAPREGLCLAHLSCASRRPLVLSAPCSWLVLCRLRKGGQGVLSLPGLGGTS
jgi:hypothetical protein